LLLVDFAAFIVVLMAIDERWYSWVFRTVPGRFAVQLGRRSLQAFTCHVVSMFLIYAVTDWPVDTSLMKVTITVIAIAALSLPTIRARFPTTAITAHSRPSRSAVLGQGRLL
jgi:hypothetical protein